MKKTWILAVILTVAFIFVGVVNAYNNSPERKIIEAQKELDRMHKHYNDVLEETEDLYEQLERIEELQEALGY